MMKSLLWLCLLAEVAQAGTGGGSSTPPARGELATRLAQSLSSMSLPELETPLSPMDIEGPWPRQVTISREIQNEPSIIVGEATWKQLLTISSYRGFVCFPILREACHSYLVEEGESPSLIILQDRREMMRLSLAKP